MKPKKTPQEHVTYIKLPEYIIPYMRKCHGDPMVFGKLSQYNITMVNHLVCNKYLSKVYSGLSYTSYAVELAKSRQNMALDMFDKESIPTDDDLEQMMAVRIPPEVMARDDEGRCQVVDTNVHYQFTRIGAQEFRKAASKEFWGELGRYIKSEQDKYNPLRPNAPVETRKDLILKFMDFYHIHPDHFENLYRNFARALQNNDFI